LGIIPNRHGVGGFNLDLIACRYGFLDFVIAQANNIEVGCFHVGVGDDEYPNTARVFDVVDRAAFFVEQEGGDIHWDYSPHLAGAFLRRLFLQQAQYCQGE
jgi:hypothetical protein